MTRNDFAATTTGKPDMTLLVVAIAVTSIALSAASETLQGAFGVQGPNLAGFAATVFNYVVVTVAFGGRVMDALGTRHEGPGASPFSGTGLKAIAKTLGWVVLTGAAAVAFGVAAKLTPAPEPIAVGIAGGVFMTGFVLSTLALRARLRGSP